MFAAAGAWIAGKVGAIGLKWLAIIGAVLVVGGIIVVQSHMIENRNREIARQASQMETMKGVIEANQFAMDALEDAKARSEAALQRQAEEMRRQLAAAENVKKEIRNAPPSDKGPVPGVIERALDWVPAP